MREHLGGTLRLAKAPRHHGENFRILFATAGRPAPLISINPEPMTGTGANVNGRLCAGLLDRPPDALRVRRKNPNNKGRTWRCSTTIRERHPITRIPPPV